MAVEFTLLVGIIGIIIILGVLLNRLAERTKFPSVLLLIGLGVLLGPILKIFNPLEFGSIIEIIVLFALIVVLFDAGFGIRIRSIIKNLLPALKITFVSMLITSLIVVAFVSLFFNLSLQLSILLAAILISTDITIVLPLIRTFEIQERLRNVLNLEATINSVFAILIATVVVDFIATPGNALLDIAQTIAFRVIIGLALGVFLGYLLVFTLERLKVEQRPEVLSLGAILLIYALAEGFGASGIFAVFVSGVILGNAKPPLKRIMGFENIISLLLIIFVYVILGASLNYSLFQSLGILGIVFAIVVFLSRLPAAWLQNMRWTAEEKFLFLTGPRGMTVVVLGLFYASRFPNPDFIISVIFTIMLVTIIFASLSHILLRDIGDISIKRATKTSSKKKARPLKGKKRKTSTRKRKK